MPSKKKLFQTVAVWLVCAMAAEPFAFAAPDLRAALANPLPRLEIPASVAIVEESWRAPGSSKTLILVQDAHVNESAQKNVARLLESIVRSGAARWIFLEGGAGDDSLAALRPLAAPAVRARVGKEFLAKGHLQGADFFDLTTESAARLWGVEDKALYFESLALYRSIKEGAPRAAAWTEAVDRALRALKPRIYSPELAAFDERRAAFASSGLPLTDYLDSLFIDAEDLGVPTADFPALSSLRAIKKAESGIDFAKAGEEQVRAAASLGAEDQKELLEAALRDRAPSRLDARARAPESAFYAILAEKTADRAAYPNLFRYIEYLQTAARLDAAAILSERERLEDAVYGALAVTPDEKRLVRVASAQETLRSVFALTASSREFARIERDPSSFDAVSVSGFLNRKLADFGASGEAAVFLEPAYDELFAKAARFYRLTALRDDAFLAEAFRKMDAEREATAVLVAGGYHSENLKKRLREKKVSYVCLSPRVLAETNLAKYESILLSQQVRGEVPVGAAARLGIVPARECVIVPASGEPFAVYDALRVRLGGVEEAPLALAGGRLAVRFDDPSLPDGTKDFLRKVAQRIVREEKLAPGRGTITLSRLSGEEDANETYLAAYPNGRRYAIKFNASRPDRIRNQWAVLTRVNPDGTDPDIVRPVMTGAEDIGYGRRVLCEFVVTEYAEGVNLSERQGGMTLREGADFSLALARVVGRIHEKGVVVRELKPQNVRVRPDGRPLLFDFDVSILPEYDWAGDPLGLKETVLHDFADDVHDYKADGPFAHTRRPRPDAASDVYALGLLFYYTLTKSWDLKERLVFKLEPRIRAFAEKAALPRRIRESPADPDTYYSSIAEYVRDLEILKAGGSPAGSRMAEPQFNYVKNRTLSSRYDRHPPHPDSYDGVLSHANIRDFFGAQTPFLGLLRDLTARKGAPIVWGDVGPGMGLALRQARTVVDPPPVTYGADVVNWQERIFKEDRESIARMIGPAAAQTENDYRFVPGAAENVRFPEAPDLVSAVYSLPYTEDPLAAFVNLYNQLSEGGVFVASTFRMLQREPWMDSMADWWSLIAAEMRAAGIEAEVSADVVFAVKGPEDLVLNLEVVPGSQRRDTREDRVFLSYRKKDESAPLVSFIPRTAGARAARRPAPEGESRKLTRRAWLAAAAGAAGSAAVWWFAGGKREPIPSAALDRYFERAARVSSLRWKPKVEPLYLSTNEEGLERFYDAARTRGGTKLGVSLQQNLDFLVLGGTTAAGVMDINPLVTEVALPFLGLVSEKAETNRDFVSFLLGVPVTEADFRVLTQPPAGLRDDALLDDYLLRTVTAIVERVPAAERRAHYEKEILGLLRGGIYPRLESSGRIDAADAALKAQIEEFFFLFLHPDGVTRPRLRRVPGMGQVNTSFVDFIRHAAKASLAGRSDATWLEARNYAAFRRAWAENRVFGATLDVTSAEGVRKLADFLRSEGLDPVTVAYISNVEDYYAPPEVHRMHANVLSQLPWEPDGLLFHAPGKRLRAEVRPYAEVREAAAKALRPAGARFSSERYPDWLRVQASALVEAADMLARAQSETAAALRTAKIPVPDSGASALAGLASAVVSSGYDDESLEAVSAALDSAEAWFFDAAASYERNQGAAREKAQSEIRSGLRRSNLRGLNLGIFPVWARLNRAGSAAENGRRTAATQVRRARAALASFRLHSDLGLDTDQSRFLEFVRFQMPTLRRTFAAEKERTLERAAKLLDKLIKARLAHDLKNAPYREQLPGPAKDAAIHDARMILLGEFVQDLFIAKIYLNRFEELRTRLVRIIGARDRRDIRPDDAGRIAQLVHDLEVERAAGEAGDSAASDLYREELALLERYKLVAFFADFAARPEDLDILLDAYPAAESMETRMEVVVSFFRILWRLYAADRAAFGFEEVLRRIGTLEERAAASFARNGTDPLKAKKEGEAVVWLIREARSYLRNHRARFESGASVRFTDSSGQSVEESFSFLHAFKWSRQEMQPRPAVESWIASGLRRHANRSIMREVHNREASAPSIRRVVGGGGKPGFVVPAAPVSGARLSSHEAPSVRPATEEALRDEAYIRYIESLLEPHAGSDLEAAVRAVRAFPLRDYAPLADAIRGLGADDRRMLVDFLRADPSVFADALIELALSAGDPAGTWSANVVRARRAEGLVETEGEIEIPADGGKIAWPAYFTAPRSFHGTASERAAFDLLTGIARLLSDLGAEPSAPRLTVRPDRSFDVDFGGRTVVSGQPFERIAEPVLVADVLERVERDFKRRNLSGARLALLRPFLSRIGATGAARAGTVLLPFDVSEDPAVQTSAVFELERSGRMLIARAEGLEPIVVEPSRDEERSAGSLAELRLLEDSLGRSVAERLAPIRARAGGSTKIFVIDVDAFADGAFTAQSEAFLDEFEKALSTYAQGSLLQLVSGSGRANRVRRALRGEAARRLAAKGTLADALPPDWKKAVAEGRAVRVRLASVSPETTVPRLDEDVRQIPVRGFGPADIPAIRAYYELMLAVGDADLASADDLGRLASVWGNLSKADIEAPDLLLVVRHRAPLEILLRHALRPLVPVDWALAVRYLQYRRQVERSA